MLTFEIFSLDDNYLDWMITTQLDDNYQAGRRKNRNRHQGSNPGRQVCKARVLPTDQRSSHWILAYFYLFKTVV